MKQTWFVTPVRLWAVLDQLCVVLQVLGAVLAVPALVALLAAEFLQAGAFFGTAVVVFGMGRVLWRRVEKPIDHKEALVVTALSYLLFFLTGSIPFLTVPGPSFIDAFFESVSGFTTTGFSVLDVEELPWSLLFFRAYSQWIGGLGILAISLALLASPGPSALRLFPRGPRSENILGNVIETARLVGKIYVLLTIAGFLAFLAAGMGPGDAVLHILATVSTGGFSSHQESIGHFQAPWIPVVTGIFMVAGSIAFPTYYLIARRGAKAFFADMQAVHLLALLAAAASLSALSWEWSVPDISREIFHATSALTTTGFSLTDPAGWSPQSKLLDSCFMFLGGSSGSTAGGIKIVRLVIAYRLVHWLVLHVLVPRETLVPIKYEGEVISERELRQILGFIAFYVGLLAVSSLSLVHDGHTIENSIFECTSALGTVGLSTGIVTKNLSWWSKLLLSFDMWAGRLEIIPVLVILYPRTWIPLERSK